MESKELRILHIDIERGWRGGQQQAFYLHSKLQGDNHFSLLICRKNSELESRCKKSNLTVKSISFYGEWDLFAVVKIISVIKKEKINIIIAHSSHSLTPALMAKMFKNKIKLIAIRRVDFSIGKNIFSKWKYSTKLLDRIVCVSDSIKNIISLNEAIKKKSLTIRDGIDLNRNRVNLNKIALKHKFKMPLNIQIVGTIAAFTGHKDYATLIKAIQFVVDEIRNIIFIFVGDGKLMQEMINLAKKLNVIQYVRFEGFKVNVSEYLNLFDIFVLSSKMEGLGSSILDAQSCGLPVISTKTGGIPEIIKDGFNGILVEPQNPKMLAKAIIKLYNDDELKKRLSKNALISVKEFDINITYKKYLQLFNDLVYDSNTRIK